MNTSANDSVGRPTDRDDGPNDFMVTFGTNYSHDPHPTVGIMNPAGWVHIKAFNESAAREIAQRHFGTHYAFIYPGEKFVKSKHFYPLGELVTIDAETEPLNVSQMQRHISKAILRKNEGEG